jgi:hemerythrin
MTPLHWNPEWEMGEPSLDLQHRAMLDAGNRLRGALAAGRGQMEIKRALSFLLVYVESHFKNEERLMERAGYPELDAHRAKHRSCSQRIDGLLEQCRNGSPETLGDLIEFFDYWLVEHFENSDRQFARFLQANP